jgi:hypothetical protein
MRRVGELISSRSLGVVGVDQRDRGVAAVGEVTEDVGEGGAVFEVGVDSLAFALGPLGRFARADGPRAIVVHTWRAPWEVIEFFEGGEEGRVGLSIDLGDAVERGLVYGMEDAVHAVEHCCFVVGELLRVGLGPEADPTAGAVHEPIDDAHKTPFPAKAGVFAALVRRNSRARAAQGEIDSRLLC